MTAPPTPAISSRWRHTLRRGATAAALLALLIGTTYLLRATAYLLTQQVTETPWATPTLWPALTATITAGLLALLTAFLLLLWLAIIWPLETYLGKPRTLPHLDRLWQPNKTPTPHKKTP